MEGILLATSKVKRELGLGELTIGIGITASYPSHPQLCRLSFSEIKDSHALCSMAQVWLSWLKRYEGSQLLQGVQVIPFIDHGWAESPADLDLMENENIQDAFGVIHL
jgi:hypothetical protein